jgi:hypothetical protein
MLRRLVHTAVFVLAATLSAAVPRSTGQLPVARVQGVLQTGVFFGPPNYGENPGSDRREIEFYLQLPAPIGTQNPNLKLGADYEKLFEHFVQVRFAEADNTRARSLVGRKVAVEGTLEPQMTGHDRTGITMTAKKFDEIKDWSW